MSGEWEGLRHVVDMYRPCELNWHDEVSLRASVIRPYVNSDAEAWYAAEQWVRDDGWYQGGYSQAGYAGYTSGQAVADAAAWTEWFALVVIPAIMAAVWTAGRWLFLGARFLVRLTVHLALHGLMWLIENPIARWAVRRVEERCKRAYGDENWAWRAASTLKETENLLFWARRWGSPEVQAALDVLRAGAGKRTWAQDATEGVV
ncbi:MAG: hypothetical protein QME76_07055 [Bacillota bacterium]|nr:hypothetical protein [Bacillota bacterium]